MTVKWGTSWIDAPAEEIQPPVILGGVENWYPAEFTGVYTSTFFPLVMPSIDGDPSKQRIFYARSLLRDVDIVEYKLINGVWTPYAPIEFNGDNKAEGKAVDCKLVWVWLSNWRLQMRLYASVERYSPSYQWTAKMAYPDPPIIFDYGRMIRNIVGV